ncbi:MAG: hypothetical protein ACTSW2_05470 [Alphaproteobacteria bacterium]
MALRIDTFSNVKGGNSFFKAIGHPLTARRMTAFLRRLADGPVAIYDPYGFAGALAEIYDLSGLNLAGVFVQDIGDLGKTVLEQPTQPVTSLKESAARRVLVAAFDAKRLIDHIGHLIPDGAETLSLDDVRIDADMLTDRRHYLNSLNFATNLVLFRDAGGQHTRLITANYWSGYGAKAPEMWCSLMDDTGTQLAEWREVLPPAYGTIVIDSEEVRRRFGLGEFTGHIFLHVLGIAGHDVVKYALDTYGDDAESLSCTHDANAWPAERYAGLPAPNEDERVVLWVQNSHPAPIPAASIGLNVMGTSEVAWLQHEIPPYGVHALDTRSLLPAARWPQQIEVQAGKHFVRPRYEVFAGNGRSRIAHAKVERTDLSPDTRLPDVGNLMGKGYILPAPVLPSGRFRSIVMPTPMSTTQETLPVKIVVYDAAGREVAAKQFGCLPRDHAEVMDVSGLMAEGSTNGAGDWGHMELVYDFIDGGEADGWLHGLFRYEDRKSGHIAETSFGAHMFNTVLTYRGEPQSYAGPAPGLSTRLFLRLGAAPADTLCHLIYAASTPWHAHSQTCLTLYDRTGTEIAAREVKIPCGGSLLWRISEMFEDAELTAAGKASYVLIRDTTCRLFGYHGLMHGETAFSFDHMFGF